MRFEVLGPVLLADDAGSPCALRPQTQRLAAFLLAAAGRPVPADRIGEMLGVAHLDGSGVRMALSRLRSVTGDRLETTTSGYRLVPAAGELDSAVFDAALVAPAGESLAARVERLRSALALWRGDPYGEFGSEEWAIAEATRLERERLDVVEDLAEALIESAVPGDAVLLLEANLGALRYRERTVALLMEALAGSGRITEALRAFQDFRRTLVDEIGIEPTEALRRLEADLLVDDGTFAKRRRRRSAGTAGNLVEPATSFVGRVAELDDLVAGLATSRLVSLVGPGGVGKTRLAVAAALSVAGSYPDGSWFVDLAPLPGDDAVAHLTAGTLGAHVGRDADLVASIVEHLRGRHALVVVDNCEHVRAGAASVVGAVVAACPNVRVIATSREPLGTPGERVQPVAPFGLDDGLELFRARAADAGRRAAFDADDELAIAEILRRVEGMPLAIELAAMRMRSATPTEIVERLDVLLLDPGVGRGVPDRHRTTRSVVEWSYRMLGEQQQALFERLSVFAGHFDAGSATAVCEFAPIATDAVPELLASLVDKSMLVAEQRAGRTRFRLLDTMRQYGQDRLVQRGVEQGPGSMDDLVARHREHLLSVANLVGLGFADDPASAVALMDDHWDDWRLAVDRALESDDPRALSTVAKTLAALWPTMVTFRAEIALWITAVRARLPVDHRVAQELLFADAQWSMVLGDLTRAISIATSGVDRGFPNANMLWYVIADAQQMSGNAPAALAAAVESLQGAEGDVGEGLFLGTACRSALALEPWRVRPWAERLCTVAAQNGRADDRARAAYAMGLASLVDDDLGTALVWFREGREAARGMRGLESEALQGIARTAAALGSDEAEAAMLEALIALRDDGNWMYTWAVLESMATYWATHERADDAAVLLGHLESHVPPSSVDAASRQHALEVVRADPRLAVLLQRGATMPAPDVLQFAIGRLGG